MKKAFLRRLWPLGLACGLLPAWAQAERPLWELGLGVGAVSFPDYRGSDRQRTHLLPVPYLIYRGELFKADRDGMRGVLFDSNRVELSLSLAASVPVDSDGNAARRGMPDLAPTLELGPSLQWQAWRSPDRRMRLAVRLPLRTAIALRGGVHDAGLVFSPTLNLDVREPFGAAGWNLGLLAGPVFGDRRQHAYFYSVAPRHAAPGRPAYTAQGGYGGAQFVMALSKRYERFWVGSFVRYDHLGGAVFADSPLVRRERAWAAGIGVAWLLGQSARTVPVAD